MSLILTRTEIADLTGYQRPGCQIRQLRAYGLRFFIAADGYPRVLCSDLGAKRTATHPSTPNFAALDLLAAER